MFNDITDNTIIICNNESKIQILKELKKIINIKFYTFSEFIKMYYFDYDEKTILYLTKKYNMTYDIALEYLNNLYYIEDINYNIEKLDYLVSIKKELIKNNLLIYNDRFKEFIKDKKIIVYNYPLNKFDKHVLENLNYEVILNNNYNYKPSIYEFDSIDEEVEFVAYKISELLNNNIDISQIKLTNVNDDYINIIDKIFSFYNLKIDKFNKIPIMSTVIGNKFYTNLTLGISEALEKISDYSNTDIYNKIINICNKYIWCEDINDLKILLEYELNHQYIDNIKYTNMIQVVDLKNYNFKDDYVFLLGFNQGTIPINYKDEDYINDSIKPSYLPDANELNKLEKDIVLKCIRNIKNLIITYKLSTPFNIYYPSSLIDDLDVEIKKVDIDLTKSYSSISNKIKLAQYLDNLIKYGEKHKKLNVLSNNYNILYNTYSSNFTGIKEDKIKSYISNLKEFNLSYSSMDNYNRCAFRFYIEKILCLKQELNKFSVELGNLYHHILEIGLKNEINIRSEVYNYITNNEIELDNSNKFFIERTIDNLEFLLNYIKDKNKYCSMNMLETEKNIKINIKDNINFIGFIDKIMYLNNNGVKDAAIIDYKTYVKKPSLKYIDFGIGLQLPTYMYLAKKEFKNIRFSGFYLQNILLDNKSIEEKNKSLKLIGYTNLDTTLLSEFDNNYKDSSIIDSLKINNDGSFSSNSLKHMLTDEKIEELINITEQKIDETISNILSSKFDINPKYDNANIGCEFCNYKDICFMNESNFVRIKSSEN